MAHNLRPSGSTSDEEDTLDLNTIFCLPSEVPEADVVAEKLEAAGYEVIRQDDKCTIYAPPEGCSSCTQGVEATFTSRKSLRAKEDVVRDVLQAKIVCGGEHLFTLASELPLTQGQLVPQTLTVKGLLRTFRVKDLSEWARVEVTGMQWNVSPNMVADEKHVGYFVDCVELKVRPKWADPSVACRHAPKTEVATIEETTMLQEEKSGSVQLSLSKAFGASVGGGMKRTKGMEQKVTKVPCEEYWLVADIDDDGVFGAYYKWEMHYWENADSAPSRGPTLQQHQQQQCKQFLSLLPPVPKVSMLKNEATVDWIWPPGTTTHQLPLEWEFSCVARAVFLTQKEKKKLFIGKAYQIVPSILHVGKTFDIKLQLNHAHHVRETLSRFLSLLPPQFAAERWFFLMIPLIILAMIAVKFM